MALVVLWQSVAARGAGCEARPVDRNNLTIRGASLWKDGGERIPKGVDVTALTFPADSVCQQGCATCREATAAFGPAELDAIAAMGADAVRLPITEMYLDPQNPAYDRDYLRQIVDAVGLMRRHGFVVILAMFRPYADPAATLSYCDDRRRAASCAA